MAVKKLLRCLYWLVARVPWGLWSGCWGVACCVLGYGLGNLCVVVSGQCSPLPGWCLVVCICSVS